MQAIILAGGKGTRLQSLISDVPKPMAPINGKPFLWYLLDHLKSFPLRDIIFSVGYKAQIIQDYFGMTFGPFKITYSVESEPLGTGGAIKQSLTVAKPISTLVLNGDTFCPIDYDQMFKSHQSKNSLLSIALCQVKDTSRYGTVEIRDDKIIKFCEKGNSGPGWINSGAYILSPRIFENFSLPKKFSLEKDFLEPYLSKLNPFPFKCEKSFIDIGTPVDYQKAESFFEV